MQTENKTIRPVGHARTPTQREQNPYRHTDSNKRYFTYEYYTRLRFGGRCVKAPLDIGASCPNRQGTAGGCIYCLHGSSSAAGDTMEAQFAAAAATARAKWKQIAGWIPYFQAGTNTFGDPARFFAAFRRAARLPGVVMVDIATRADCLPPAVIDGLCRLAEEIPVTVELGLQTVHDRTAARIGRGHTMADFLDGYARLRAAADRLNGDAAPGFGRLSVGVHLIAGLPGETEADMLASAGAVASLRPDLVKLHTLLVLRDTPLARLWEAGEYTPLTRDAACRILAEQLTLLPPDTVIGRVTGDAPVEDLCAPLWTRRKTEAANDIDRYLFTHGLYQGCRFSPQTAGD